MTSPAKQKGDRFERDVVAYLREHGFPYADRAYGAGRTDDVGDIDGVVGMVIECRDRERVRIPAWFAETEAKTDDKSIPAVFSKRPRRRVEDALVTIRLADFCSLVRDDAEPQ